MGNDGAEPVFLTVEAAKQRCGAEVRCQGFTFEGTDPEGPLSGGPVWVHLKHAFDCIEAEWIAYRKVAGKGPSRGHPNAALQPNQAREQSHRLGVPGGARELAWQ